MWSENIETQGGVLPLSVPEGGMYQVIIVKLDAPQKPAAPKRRSAREFIGYCRRFNPQYKSTAEIMKELREGDEE